MQTAAPELKLARLSRARYDAMIAAGILTENDAVELLDGQLYEAMPKGKKHNARISRLTETLVARFLRRCTIYVQNSIALHEYSEPEPDIAVLRHREDFYENTLPEPRDVLFLIEVSDSTLAYDRDLKIPLYAAADIAEVWLLDVQAATVTVYREPEGNRYRVEETFRSGDTIPVAAFPGESIAVSELGL